MLVCTGTQKKVPDDLHGGQSKMLLESLMGYRALETLVYMQLCMGSGARHVLHQPQHSCCICDIRCGDRARAAGDCGA
jgi:hypothetical protein